MDSSSSPAPHAIEVEPTTTTSRPSIAHSELELPADRAVLVTEDDLLSSQFTDVLYPEDTLVVIGKLFADKKFLPVLQLPFKGFQGMHLLQVKINEHEVWSDLERLGYDHKLEAIEVAELFPLES
ncbi:hypothetical protein BCR44DRAFT_1066852 [Catenaria anguillulae PL171]|uniref:Uncharacterized protein n=1 Tax=Catenaria anguillulae PL171 TaxID=765915 RepID=A0A1Y2HPI6_9FUNG|nr:hypothetical protein BCR44DRAFT_1066852 [Catenaria anguillulae PL171]